jgi:hypothetical protein
MMSLPSTSFFPSTWIETSGAELISACTSALACGV